MAIALHKQNINAQVYEKAQQLRLVNVGLSHLPNCLKKDKGDRTRQILKIGFIITNYPKNFGLNY